MNDEENVKTDMCDGQVTLKGDNDGNAIKLITIIVKKNMTIYIKE